MLPFYTLLAIVEDYLWEKDEISQGKESVLKRDIDFDEITKVIAGKYLDFYQQYRKSIQN